jgi:K+-sensing histidine kinase KdpD
MGRASTAHVPYPREYHSGWLMDSMTSELDHKVFTPRGHLRTYLGFAPGVGKTYSMLAEGRRRAEGGERVVIGWIERHGRSETKAQLRDLEAIAPRQALYRGRRGRCSWAGGSTTSGWSTGSPIG